MKALTRRRRLIGSRMAPANAGDSAQHGRDNPGVRGRRASPASKTGRALVRYSPTF
jgi:hypothetical protein